MGDLFRNEHFQLLMFILVRIIIYQNLCDVNYVIVKICDNVCKKTEVVIAEELWTI